MYLHNILNIMLNEWMDVLSSHHYSFTSHKCSLSLFRYVINTYGNLTLLWPHKMATLFSDILTILKLKYNNILKLLKQENIFMTLPQGGHSCVHSCHGAAPGCQPQLEREVVGPWPLLHSILGLILSFPLSKFLISL